MLEGKNIVIVGRNSEILRQMVASMTGNGANVFVYERESEMELEEWVKAIVSIDIHGFVSIPDFDNTVELRDLTIDNLQSILQTNVIFQTVIAKRVTELMRNRNISGSVVFVTDTMALDGCQETAFSTSMAAMHGLTLAMSKELGSFNIRVNAVALGIFEALRNGLTADDLHEIAVKMVDLRRAGKLVEAANACIFLLSDLSSHITGQILRVDGGAMMMSQKRLLEGKTIVVTGSARGIGKKMIELFASHGASIFALARMMTSEHIQYCKNLENKYMVKVIPIYFDMTEFDAMKECVITIKSYGMRIDGLVNNAGISSSLKLMPMVSNAELREVMEINFISPYVFSQHIVKLMIKNKSGSIVNIASIRGLDAYAGDTAYASSKAALILMTKCLAEEIGRYGVRANAVCPGITETDMTASLSDKNRNIELAATPLNKFASPLDIANAALFLLSDLSSYITGQILRVDGGVTCMEKRA